MTLPTAEELHNAEAGTLWNILCCPLVGTIGMIYRSLEIYFWPCFRVVSLRIANVVHKTCCFCCGWPYEDNDFYGAKALGGHTKEGALISAEDMEKDTDWVRAHELDAFGGKRPQLFEGEIEPDDLCQGAVGDCWLVAAFACASEHPDSIRRLFKTVEYNPRGMYAIRIFDPVKKKWNLVRVDDRIPCKKGTKRPRFMNPNGSELWAIILEKAYAKFCGSYAALDGGFVLWGWHAMTGDNVFQLSKNKDGSNTWYREDMVAIDDKKDKRACGFKKTKETYTEDNIWTLLKKYDRQKSLLSASIGKTEYGKYSGPAGEEILEEEGLAAGHAYSLIQAREVTDSKKISAIPGIKMDTDLAKTKPKIKLLQLRNPWGTFEWKGDWSDKSKKWAEHPNVKKELGLVDADDGTFWMCWDDFKRIYTRINVCDRSTAMDASLDARENDGSCGIISGCICGCAEFWCLCKGYRNLYCGHRSTDETLDAQERGCCGIC